MDETRPAGLIHDCLPGIVVDYLISTEPPAAVIWPLIFSASALKIFIKLFSITVIN